MKQYQVINAPVTLPVGMVVYLDETQAALHSDKLEKQDKPADKLSPPFKIEYVDKAQEALHKEQLAKQDNPNPYKVLSPIILKYGDILGVDDSMDKAMLSALLPMERLQLITPHRPRPITIWADGYRDPDC